jgi:hypothetical protein
MQTIAELERVRRRIRGFLDEYAGVVPVPRNLSDLCIDLTLIDAGVSYAVQCLSQEGDGEGSPSASKAGLVVQMVDSIFGRVALNDSPDIDGAITDEDVLCFYLERRKISRILDDLKAREGGTVAR